MVGRATLLFDLSMQDIIRNAVVVLYLIGSGKSEAARN